MEKKTVVQLANEMTELCTDKARSAYLFADSPIGKALYLVVLTVLVEVMPFEDHFWWKPPLPPSAG